MYFEMRRGKLVIFSAPSGAGKTTIVRHLLTERNDLKFSVSATSRAPRAGETNGKDYYFISVEEFRKKIDNNEFLEWEEVYPGTYYGSLKSEVEENISNGWNVIFDVDVVGGLNIKNHFGKEALSIFVQPPSLSVLEQRLRFRSTETEEKIRTRLEKAATELSFAAHFDVIIINDRLDHALNEARKIVSGFLD